MTSAKEYVKLEYRLPNGQAAKFLNEAKTYLGNQLECEYGGDIRISTDLVIHSGLIYHQILNMFLNEK